MYMLKFWMVLSSIVLGMALPVARGYAQEEMYTETEVASGIAGVSVDEKVDIEASNEIAGEKLPVQTEEPSEQEEAVDLEETIEEKPVVSEQEVATEVLVESEANVQESQSLEEDGEDTEVTSIDTVDLNDPQGNWLIKRFWFNKAEQLYGQMSQRVQRIFDFGAEFQQKSAELDQKLFDPFYIEIGIDRGALNELVDSLIEQLGKKDELVAERDEKESEYLQRLEEEKGTLEQLKADIEGVSDIDSAVNSALATFNERANLSRNYHNKAFYLFQEIAHELNDKKARELYFTIKSLARSIIDIEEYITSPFTQYFDELSNKAGEQINRIKQEVAVLEQKGIDLKERVNELENVQHEKELEEAVQDGYTAAEIEQQKREEKERGFFSSIGSMVQYMWNAFYSFLQKLFAPEEKRETQAEVVQHQAKEQPVVETQEQEISVAEAPIEAKEVELEHASDAEQQEAMIAGTEEVELIKAAEEVKLPLPEADMSDVQSVEKTDPSPDVVSRKSAPSDTADDVLEVQPATSADQEPAAASVEQEVEQAQ